MGPGDLVFWEDKLFGHHRFWRVESVLLGAERQESLVRLVSLSHNAGMNEVGEHQHSVLVPECLVRGMVFNREGQDEPDMKREPVLPPTPPSAMPSAIWAWEVDNDGYWDVVKPSWIEQPAEYIRKDARTVFHIVEGGEA